MRAPTSEASAAVGSPTAVAAIDASLRLHRQASEEMAHRAVEVVRARLDSGHVPGDVVVLSRVASALLAVQVALGEAGVAHTSPLDVSVLTRTGIRTALAYLRMGSDLERIRRDDVLETINRPARKVKSAVSPLLPRSSTTSMNQLEAMTSSLDTTHRERFGEYLGDLHTLEGVITAGATTSECLGVIRDRIGLGEAMDALDASRSRPEGSSHGDDLDALQQLAAFQPDPSAFAGWLTERLRIPADPTGVTLSTIHRVKGREWACVVVFAANRGLFPHRLADDVEEERRVFHVAVTRCRDHLDIIADRARTSPFVAELTADPPVHHGPAQAVRTGPDTTEPSRSGRDTDDPPERRTEVVTPRWRDASTVVAEPGLAVTFPGGVSARILEVSAARIRVRPMDVDVAELWVRLPTPVFVEDRRGTLAAPSTPAVSPETATRPAESEADDGLFEALRAWRAGVASQTGVPAYLVFHDRHLRTIAGRRPQTLRELAACPGVGPAKLERFGDDVLDVVAAHHPGPTG